MASTQPIVQEPSIALGELAAVLERLDAGDVAGARQLLEGWRPVAAGELPAFIGKGLVPYVGLVDRVVGLLGGFLRHIGTRDNREARVERVHRAYERFARSYAELYTDELDAVEAEDDVDTDDELDAELRRKAAQLAAAEVAPIRAAAFRRHLAQLVAAGGTN